MSKLVELSSLSVLKTLIKASMWSDKPSTCMSSSLSWMQSVTNALMSLKTTNSIELWLRTKLKSWEKAQSLKRQSLPSFLKCSATSSTFRSRSYPERWVTFLLSLRVSSVSTLSTTRLRTRRSCSISSSQMAMLRSLIRSLVELIQRRSNVGWCRPSLFVLVTHARSSIDSERTTSSTQKRLCSAQVMSSLSIRRRTPSLIVCLRSVLTRSQKNLSCVKAHLSSNLTRIERLRR